MSLPHGLALVFPWSVWECWWLAPVALEVLSVLELPVDQYILDLPVDPVDPVRPVDPVSPRGRGYPEDRAGLVDLWDQSHL